MKSVNYATDLPFFSGHSEINGRQTNLNSSVSLSSLLTESCSQYKYGCDDLNVQISCANCRIGIRTEQRRITRSSSADVASHDHEITSSGREIYQRHAEVSIE
jgi:hypothetical protein